MSRISLAILSLALSIPLSAAPASPRIDWPGFFPRQSATGVTYSEELRKLEGKRVILRGYAVSLPAIDGGILLTRFQHDDPHDVQERDLPFDAVAVIWNDAVDVGPVPVRPTVVGTLRLGNTRVGDETVVVTLEAAQPWIEPLTAR
ncbi:MAG: hypothetical protein WC538_13390 [Thermoanaerobaculia bacterium]|jgi:hypothetical protein